MSPPSPYALLLMAGLLFWLRWEAPPNLRRTEWDTLGLRKAGKTARLCVMHVSGIVELMISKNLSSC